MTVNQKVEHHIDFVFSSRGRALIVAFLIFSQMGGEAWLAAEVRSSASPYIGLAASFIWIGLDAWRTRQPLLASVRGIGLGLFVAKLPNLLLSVLLRRAWQENHGAFDSPFSPLIQPGLPLVVVSALVFILLPARMRRTGNAARSTLPRESTC